MVLQGTAVVSLLWIRAWSASCHGLLDYINKQTSQVSKQLVEVEKILIYSNTNVMAFMISLNPLMVSAFDNYICTIMFIRI